MFANDVTTEITYRDKTFKLVFNLNVMEKIQEEYKTLDKWGALTDGSETGETDIKALIFGFTEMLNEGIDIKNEEEGLNEPFLTKKQVGRIVTEIGLDNVLSSVNKTVISSTESDEKNSLSMRTTEEKQS